MIDIRKLRALQHVRRFNFERCNRYQSVAEHSFYVALLARQAAFVLKNQDGNFQGFMGLMHDATEAALGDIPYLVRKNMDSDALWDLEHMAEVEIGGTPGTSVVVTFCDALELAMYLKEERESGNRTLIAIEYETRGRLVRHPLWPCLREWAYGLLETTEEGFGVTFPEPTFLKH